MTPSPIRTYTLSRRLPLDPEGGMTIGTALDAAWGKLSDFDSWPGWVPTVRGAQIPGNATPGRGAQVQVQFGTEQWDFTIAHWEPSRRLVLVAQTPPCRVAYAFDLRGENEQLCLTATVEVQCFGLARLLAYKHRAKHRQRCNMLLNAW